jgi:hypothetical protein
MTTTTNSIDVTMDGCHTIISDPCVSQIKWTIHDAHADHNEYQLDISERAIPRKVPLSNVLGFDYARVDQHHSLWMLRTSTMFVCRCFTPSPINHVCLIVCSLLLNNTKRPFNATLPFFVETCIENIPKQSSKLFFLKSRTTTSLSGPVTVQLTCLSWQRI